MNPKIVNALSAMAILAAPPGLVSVLDHFSAVDSFDRTAQHVKNDLSAAQKEAGGGKKASHAMLWPRPSRLYN